ncbi:kirola-like [Impatiens glandulifera]|uniref:kirola-like n=1 Tax=Impatiens glandulifera TaxID=253017 RepID=UPI001FB148C1|nr:kirola-like [Impatiens glandulifera]
MAHIGLSKLVKQVEIKSDGDVFHELFRFQPHHISNISPTNIQNVDLHEGDWGTIGSVIFWNYTHDGKEKVAKERIEAIDEEKKSVTFNVIEGDLLELYKICIFTVHVDTDGENNLVTWTVEYEKLNEDVEDPTSMLDFCIVLTKDIETHHLNN